MISFNVETQNQPSIAKMDDISSTNAVPIDTSNIIETLWNRIQLPHSWILLTKCLIFSTFQPFSAPRSEGPPWKQPLIMSTHKINLELTGVWCNHTNLYDYHMQTSHCTIVPVVHHCPRIYQPSLQSHRGGRWWPRCISRGIWVQFSLSVNTSSCCTDASRWTQYHIDNEFRSINGRIVYTADDQKNRETAVLRFPHLSRLLRSEQLIWLRDMIRHGFLTSHSKFQIK